MSGLTRKHFVLSIKCLMEDRFCFLGCSGGFIRATVSPLYKALQQTVQDMAPVPHQLDVLRCAVHTLPVQNGTLKHVAELLTRT